MNQIHIPEIVAIIQRYLVAFALSIASVSCGRPGRAVSVVGRDEKKQKRRQNQPLRPREKQGGGDENEKKRKRRPERKSLPWACCLPGQILLDQKMQPRHLKLLPGQAAVTRDCFECGRVCSLCAPLAARTCKRCRSAYCILHNTGCDEMTCDWCMYRGGRGTRELY